jgi:cysteine desulfuration protein SufE
MAAEVPGPLGEIIAEFQDLSEPHRLELLLEYGEDLPPLPAQIRARRGELEPVAECLAPVFVLALLEACPAQRAAVRLFIDAPAQAPTTRGFAGVVHAGLDGLDAIDVLGVPIDLPSLLGLGTAISPRRRAGMTGLMTRIQRQVRAQLDG